MSTLRSGKEIGMVGERTLALTLWGNQLISELSYL
jgi:hypothetical protein